MREEILLNDGWLFKIANKEEEKVNLPHSWNGKDGQDGGNDYLRDVGEYKKNFSFKKKDSEDVYLIFNAVNSLCDVYLNGEHIIHHEGGYSTFGALVTDKLKEENELIVKADNKEYSRIYPLAADFTFYGGIYRDVKLLTMPKSHFEFNDDMSSPLKCDVTIKDKKGILNVKAKANTNDSITIELLDKDGNVVASGKPNEDIILSNPHLWDGLNDPYLYTVKGKMEKDGQILDEIEVQVGFRTFYVNPKRDSSLMVNHIH